VASVARREHAADLVALAKSKARRTGLLIRRALARRITSMPELLMKMTGIEHEARAVSGGGPALTTWSRAMCRSTLPDAGPALSLIPKRQAQALGVSTGERVATMSEVPTLNEARGRLAMDAKLLEMFAGPANMPAPIVAKLKAAVSAFMLTPEAQQHFTSLGCSPKPARPKKPRHYPRRGRALDWILKGMASALNRGRFQPTAATEP